MSTGKWTTTRCSEAEIVGIASSVRHAIEAAVYLSKRDRDRVVVQLRRSYADRCSYETAGSHLAEMIEDLQKPEETKEEAALWLAKQPATSSGRRTARRSMFA